MKRGPDEFQGKPVDIIQLHLKYLGIKKEIIIELLKIDACNVSKTSDQV